MATPATQNIPPIAQPFVSQRAKDLLDKVYTFVDEECIPADVVYSSQIGTGDARWHGHPSILEELKKKAHALGIWNMFLPKNHFKDGPQFTNVEYGLMAEQLGKSITASEACNCAAPDTGNMEVIARYGTAAQKDRWLKPLLAGQIRSGFLMTEPDIASSDGSNIQLRMERRGDHYVLNGSKWWSSGAGDDRCKIFIVMGKTDPQNPDKYKQQSMMLVPADTPGIQVHRMLSVYGYDDAPHGHGHITFKDVRVPLDAIILGEGRGFEIMQGRLGPGRIHHAMRAIGAAERALEWMINRLNDTRKVPFGKPLSEHGVLLEWVAKARIEIDASRLIVLNAAIKIDQKDAKFALREIAEAKVKVPQVALEVIDRAIQAHGAMGVCQDTPLASMWAHLRTLRIADGPDEAHLHQLGRRENKQRKDEIKARIARQLAKTEQIFRDMGIEKQELGAAKFKPKAKL
ncbi:acyl-CoA dehydrogenase [Cladophialophora yegresii CBS 114405]|uniref:Acyl-CoA dehydrogenase n=1 Tax=Cladophialophora yegresii CBS 114405 TaxID=1182544 RepID=W9WDI1_9EURO|nr:acyl-CoA dehydrogenase [Cladophialophora yegresii CBS 114405]EXJ62621.1 acyl-CoA dehydrogenase [Cladophialophora yegresii CBS 114405]